MRVTLVTIISHGSEKLGLLSIKARAGFVEVGKQNEQYIH